LSLPSSFDDQIVTGLAERIFIPIPGVDGGVPQEVDDTPDIDVPVKRKAA